MKVVNTDYVLSLLIEIFMSKTKELSDFNPIQEVLTFLLVIAAIFVFAVFIFALGV